MPLFEVDARRPLLVQTGRPQVTREPGVGTTAHAVVETHIDGLLGEQIFPVAPGSGPHEPHLLALDATGSPVVVELVAELDRSALTTALDHAGAAGRLTRGELASRYHGGPAAFHRDVAAFYDSVPITRSQPGRSSARLIIICQEAGEAILNAVDFLRQPTMPVEVLKMGVVHSADGRRFVDVSPLVIHPAASATAPSLSAPKAAAPGPASPGVGAPGSAASDGAGSGAFEPGAAGTATSRPEARADRAERADRDPELFAEGVAVGLALTGKSPASVQPARRRAAAPERSRAATSPAADPSATAGPAPTAVPPAPASVPPPPAPAEPVLGSGLAGARVEQPRRTPVRRRSRADRFNGTTDGVVADPTSEHPPVPATPPVPASSATPPVPAPTFAPAVPAPAPVPAPPSRRRRPIGESFAEVVAPAFDQPVPRRWSELDDPSPVPEPRWSGAEDDLPRLQVPPLEAPRLADPLDRSLPTYRESSYDAGPPSDPTPRSGRSSYPDPLTSPLPPERWSPDRASGRVASGGGYLLAHDDEPDPDLVALASTLHRPAAIVWSRPRRGQHFEATLHTDGTIELGDGSRFRSPDAAASRAAGSPTAEGWSVWRLADGSGSLEDVFRRRFS